MNIFNKSALPSHGRGHRFNPCRAHHINHVLIRRQYTCTYIPSAYSARRGRPETPVRGGSVAAPIPMFRGRTASPQWRRVAESALLTRQPSALAANMPIIQPRLLRLPHTAVGYPIRDILTFGQYLAANAVAIASRGASY